MSNVGVKSICRATAAFSKDVLRNPGPVFTKKLNQAELAANIKSALSKDFKVANSSNPLADTVKGFDGMFRKGMQIREMAIPTDQFLSSIPQKGKRKVVASLLGNADTVVCSAKANTKGSGFSILGFVGKKGDKEVCKGAVSISDLGKPDAVAKWKFSGKHLKTSGYVDCAQSAKPENKVATLVKKMFGVETQAGDMARIDTSINAKKAIDLLPSGELATNVQNATGNVINFIKNLIS